MKPFNLWMSSRIYVRRFYEFFGDIYRTLSHLIRSELSMPLRVIYSLRWSSKVRWESSYSQGWLRQGRGLLLEGLEAKEGLKNVFNIAIIEKCPDDKLLRIYSNSFWWNKLEWYLGVIFLNMRTNLRKNEEHMGLYQGVVMDQLPGYTKNQSASCHFEFNPSALYRHPPRPPIPNSFHNLPNTAIHVVNG